MVIVTKDFQVFSLHTTTPRVKQYSTTKRLHIGFGYCVTGEYVQLVFSTYGTYQSRAQDLVIEIVVGRELNPKKF